jgi:hypothetical protein
MPARVPAGRSNKSRTSVIAPLLAPLRCAIPRLANPPWSHKLLGGRAAGGYPVGKLGTGMHQRDEQHAGTAFVNSEGVRFLKVNPDRIAR